MVAAKNVGFSDANRRNLYFKWFCAKKCVRFGRGAPDRTDISFNKDFAARPSF